MTSLSGGAGQPGDPPAREMTVRLSSAHPTATTIPERIFRIRLRRPSALSILVVLAIAAPALVLGVWQLDALGFNSDEAVYAGQAASLA